MLKGRETVCVVGRGGGADRGGGYVRTLYSVLFFTVNLDFPGSSEGKAFACNVGDPGLIPGSGRSPGEGNGTPLQYSCLENPMNREAW